MGSIPISTNVSMMNSETSTRAAHGVAPHVSSGVADGDSLQPWQLFTLAGLAGATTVVFMTREAGPAGVILLSLTVGAAAWMGHTAWRTLAPLFGLQVTAATEVVGGRTRAALERDKALVLRAIRDLEFDRAMRKVSDKDFADMNARLRARAAGILKQLDSGAGYRDEIERELQKRLGSAATKVAAYEESPGSRVSAGSREGSNVGPHVSSGSQEFPNGRSGSQEPPNVGPNFSSGSHEESNAGPNFRSGVQCTCGTTNDTDARFCKACGARLQAA
jgi:hypothetical protein